MLDLGQFRSTLLFNLEELLLNNLLQLENTTIVSVHVNNCSRCYDKLF